MHKYKFMFLFVMLFFLTNCSVIKNGNTIVKSEASFEEQIQKIKHLVVIYMENRSFDHLFGEFEGANGIQNIKKGDYVQVDKDGKPYEFLPAIPKNSDFPTNLPNKMFNIDEYVANNKKTPDVTHRFYQNQLQINGGKMDQFVLHNSTGGLTMGYYTTNKLPLYPIAKEYTLCDNFFQSVFGGSFFNHFFLISASVPVWKDAPKSRIAELDANGKLIKDGTVTPDGYAVNTVFAKTQPFHPKVDKDNMLPLQGMPTIGDRLSEKNISWAWYSEGWNTALAGEKTNFAYNHEPFIYFSKYAPGTEGRKHLKDQTDYLNDAKQGTLPAVSFVKPGVGNDEHPGGSAVYPSEELAVRLINAALEGPQKEDVLVILTYDEFGGLFDHVRPPVIDRWGPGTRIPAIIIGPFAKKGYVDSTQYETVSILSFIEKRWGLKPLGERDKNANPFRNALHFE